MQFDRYANRAAELAAALVNLYGAPPTLSDLRAFLDTYTIPARPLRRDLPALADLAEAMRPVFTARDLETAVDRLNRLMADTPMAPRVSMHDGRPPHLHVEPARAPLPDRLRANCLMGLAAVLCDGRRLRLGGCDAPDCDRVYVDTSRNARRRFCSDTCATRVHVAAHRARKAVS